MKFEDYHLSENSLDKPEDFINRPWPILRTAGEAYQYLEKEIAEMKKEIQELKGIIK